MKRQLRRAGFFRDRGGQGDLSISEAHWGVRSPNEVVQYLRGGALFIGSPGPVRCLYDASCGFAGTPSVLTDGVWAWRDDIVHFVEAHGLVLPADFVEHMHGVNFSVPELSIVELRQLLL